MKEGVPCFRLGKDFTAIDAIMIPTLERWRWQLPLTSNIDILEGRPALKQWFDAMDSYPPYRDRVMGDEYSWTATNSMFLRYFADEDDPDTATAIQRADDAAARGRDNRRGGADQQQLQPTAARLAATAAIST